MGEIMKNAKKEFGKKAGKALGNAVFGMYAEDKRIGVRYEQGSAKKPRKGRSTSKQVEDEQRESLPTMTADAIRAQAEERRKDRAIEIAAEERRANKRIKDESDVLSLEFDPEDPKQIVRQLSKLSSVVELTLKNEDDDDDGLGAAAESQFATGLAILKSIKPNHAMIAHFEGKKVQWKKDHRKKWWSEYGIGLVVGLFFMMFSVLFLLYMAFFHEG